MSQVCNKRGQLIQRARCAEAVVVRPLDDDVAAVLVHERRVIAIEVIDLVLAFITEAHDVTSERAPEGQVLGRKYRSWITVASQDQEAATYNVVEESFLALMAHPCLPEGIAGGP